MSEKRFEYIKGGAKDTTNEREYEEEEYIDLLNELFEENKELKQQLNKIPKNIRKVWLK